MVGDPHERVDPVKDSSLACFNKENSKYTTRGVSQTGTGIKRTLPKNFQYPVCKATSMSLELGSCVLLMIKGLPGYFFWLCISCYKNVIPLYSLETFNTW